MKIAVLTGGAGGARFLTGVKSLVGWDPTGPRPDGAADRIVAIVTTANDIRLHDLHISPDLDICMYAACGAADDVRGWGLAGETWTVSAELATYGAEAPWFRLGDRDMATHLMRTRMLEAGYPLSAVTAALCVRWRPGIDLKPMTDDRVETHIVIPDPEANDAAVAVHVQEWWIRHRATARARSAIAVGVDRSRPAPGVLDAIREADMVLIAPANPVTSIDVILAVPGIREAVVAASAPVIGFSPFTAPARRLETCLALAGIEPSTQGVAAHYGARASGGLLDAFVVAAGDRAQVEGLATISAPLTMTEPKATAEAIRAAGRLIDVHGR